MYGIPCGYVGRLHPSLPGVPHALKSAGFDIIPRVSNLGSVCRCVAFPHAFERF